MPRKKTSTKNKRVAFFNKNTGEKLATGLPPYSEAFVTCREFNACYTFVDSDGNTHRGLNAKEAAEKANPKLKFKTIAELRKERRVRLEKKRWASLVDKNTGKKLKSGPIDDESAVTFHYFHMDYTFVGSDGKVYRGLNAQKEALDKNPNLKLKTKREIKNQKHQEKRKEIAALFSQFSLSPINLTDNPEPRSDTSTAPPQLAPWESEPILPLSLTPALPLLLDSAQEMLSLPAMPGATSSKESNISDLESLLDTLEATAPEAITMDSVFAPNETFEPARQADFSQRNQQISSASQEPNSDMSFAWGSPLLP